MPFRRLAGLGVFGMVAGGCGPSSNLSTVPSFYSKKIESTRHSSDEAAIAIFGKAFVAEVKESGGLIEVFGPIGVPSQIRLRGQAITDASLHSLERCRPRLLELDLNETGVTAKGIAKLAGFGFERLTLPKQLRTDDCVQHYLAATQRGDRLDFSDWAVTDAGLRHLDKVVLQLDSLDLKGTQVTDAGVIWLAEQLANAPDEAKLQTLDLSHTAVTDEGLAALAAGKSLRRLVLEKTAVTDAGLAKLPPDLEDLDLSDTGVTDEGMKAVAGHQKLTDLSLTGTRVGDTGLAAVAGMVALRTVMVAGSRVSPAAAARFSAERPGVGVDTTARTAGQRQSAVRAGVSRGGFGSTGRIFGGSSSS